MPPIADAHADALIALTRERFDLDLREIELQVLRHSCSYEDPPNWPSGRPPEDWSGPELRPALLRWLLTEAEATALLGPGGVRVWGARFIEPLDLAHCRVSVRFEIRYCLMDAQVLLAAAEMRTLSIRNSTLRRGLAASGLRLHGSLGFEDVSAAETLFFDSAMIEGKAQFAETRLDCAGMALALDGASINNNVLLWPKFASRGMQSLEGSRIAGSLVASGAKVETTDIALALSGASIGGDALLNRGFQCAGRIEMANVQIEGALDCGGASLEATGDALALSRSKVRVDVFFNEGFRCGGRILLLGVEVGGQLNCRGAALATPGEALALYGGSIRGDVYLDEGFQCDLGIIRLEAMKLAGNLVCDEASVGYLSMKDTSIGRDFRWTRIHNPQEANLRIENVTMRNLRDDRASWPARGKLEIIGLAARELYLRSYRAVPPGATAIAEDALRSTERIDWLNSQSGIYLYEPQPWMHVAKLLENKGRKREGKRYIFALRRHEAKGRRERGARDAAKLSSGPRSWFDRRPEAHHALGFLRYGWDVLFAWLVEQPFRILLSVAFCVSAGTALFWPLQGRFAPTSEADYKATYTPAGKAGGYPVAYPKFQPLIYALENNLPILKLGQDDRWAPDPHLSSRPVYWSLMAMRWVLIFAGWVQGVVLAAAVGARFRD